MLAPNPSSYYNGRASFVNPINLKKAQSSKPCLYKGPFDKDDRANSLEKKGEEKRRREEEKKEKGEKDGGKREEDTEQNRREERGKAE
ncbi:hypothetical protein Tco_1208028, partial [Tanacetum coccineum]